MDETMLPANSADRAARQHRLELARKAFADFYAQCFWSYREDTEITEDKIPFVIRGLREHGGLPGYRMAADLIARLPLHEVGCLYLNHAGQPVDPDPSAPDFPKLTRHFGTVKGAWPRAVQA